MKTVVLYHRADFDGIFCREIARKFLPDAELIGWDFGDPPLEIPNCAVYILDLPVDRVFGFEYKKEDVNGQPPQHPAGLVWIDHHKSSIESHPKGIAGYRIDGVAACRLAWQWFQRTRIDDIPQNRFTHALPDKLAFVARNVSEPLAVRLAGEYDIWDKRDPDAELFQHGLRSRKLVGGDWDTMLLTQRNTQIEDDLVRGLLHAGEAIQYVQTEQNASIIKAYGFDVEFEGLKFLACNHARFNSLLFTAAVKPEHEALLGFNWDGPKQEWRVSLYHAEHRKDLDLSLIAVKYGGGGHRGACGFRVKTLPFLPKEAV